jgi:hypothetical protein
MQHPFILEDFLDAGGPLEVEECWADHPSMSFLQTHTVTNRHAGADMNQKNPEQTATFPDKNVKIILLQ